MYYGQLDNSQCLRKSQERNCVQGYQVQRQSKLVPLLTPSVFSLPIDYLHLGFAQRPKFVAKLSSVLISSR